MNSAMACARCAWAVSDALMRDYHDAEWGVPQRDARMLWEMLMLEGFQAPRLDEPLVVLTYAYSGVVRLRTLLEEWPGMA